MIYMKTVRPIPPKVEENMYDGKVIFINGVTELPDDRQGRLWRDRLLGLGYDVCTKEVFESARGIKPSEKVEDSTAPPPVKAAH